jgi:hypothetical protein
MSSLVHGCGMNHECIFQFVMYVVDFYYNVLVLNSIVLNKKCYNLTIIHEIRTCVRAIRCLYMQCIMCILHVVYIMDYAITGTSGLVVLNQV